MEQVTQADKAKALAWWNQYKFNGSGRDAATDAYLAATQAKDEEIARLREALEQIEKAPAWGAPERWETTPAEVRQLAREALRKAS